MHVVEHNDDLFSHKKYKSYTYIGVVQNTEMFRMLLEQNKKLFMQKYIVLTLLTVGLCCVTPRTSRRYF
jgi:hypothetical protein